MSVCAHCGSNNEAGSEFCQNCGKSMLAARASGSGSSRFAGVASSVGNVDAGKGRLTIIEQRIYFRIARVFAWLLLVLSLLGLVGGAFMATGSIRQYLKGEDAVSVADVKAAIAARKAGNSARGDGESAQTQLDPKAEGLLTTEVAEIFNLLSAEDQNKYGGKENVRKKLLDTASEVNGGNVNDQIDFLREMKKVVSEVQPQADRTWGINGFAQLKKSYKNQAAARKAVAEKEFMMGAGAVLSFAALITLVSMVLVMLAVERNTRNA
jgi:hypothetical protein